MFTVPITEIYAGYIILILVGGLVFYSLMLLYLWPLTIDFDPENPLPWNYFLKCDYWKGNMNRNAINNDDNVV